MRRKDGISHQGLPPQHHRAVRVPLPPDPNDMDFDGAGDEVDPELAAAFEQSRAPLSGNEMLDTTTPGKVGNRVKILPFNRTATGAVGSAGVLGAGAMSTLIAPQGKDKTSRLVTIALSRDMRTETGEVHKGPIVARIQFGAGGVTRFIEVDISCPGAIGIQADNEPDYQGQGCVFVTVPACALQIQARDDSMAPCVFNDESGGTNQAQDGSGADAQYSGVYVYAHVGYGSINHTGNHTPKRSYVFGNGNGGGLSNGGSIPQPIPPSARRVRFFKGAAVPAGVVVTWKLYNGLTYAAAIDGTGLSEMDVPSSATAMLITNDSGGAWNNPVMVVEFDIEP
jgi:hypothetical protein